MSLLPSPLDSRGHWPLPRCWGLNSITRSNAVSLKPKVALSQDFLFQLAKLPVNVHSKVMKWAILFQADPKSPSINYENINGARDPNLKSIRLDKDWRGIVFKPDTGDVYVLLYVDRHDDAYRWAENRKSVSYTHLTLPT